MLALVNMGYVRILAFLTGKGLDGGATAPLKFNPWGAGVCGSPSSDLLSPKQPKLDGYRAKNEKTLADIFQMV